MGFAFLLAACTTAPQALEPALAGAPREYIPRTLHDLDGLAELQALFNRDQGRTRLILLVSPT